ncbi:hypothetical protein Ptr902_05197 [Pyrenophora tritici-repentis]|uniref:Uncharacterized protein n=1 Tax=Pyrenophora tritici-repentis TaxID=45151 RepID=A0A5M9LHW2_9PLEO|nr:hypothetical protein PtrV1_04390 [Pyrenophora tritici-repentis]KAF7452077.1 hypothetical protein A1F99_038540 [Pyrenophora tritici-repentis]KAF7574805.1 hypothetical protein PtrM4_064290 [Pyrenophora tritici-repentis]KAI0588540.1 hypothetical protein Alg130_03315 [Pyrenophora tritici-repentis]KAI0589682.1 hypothetical protein Alg215_00144 [Pyrenophora tritici-repentis]
MFTLRTAILILNLGVCAFAHLTCFSSSFSSGICCSFNVESNLPTLCQDCSQYSACLESGDECAQSAVVHDDRSGFQQYYANCYLRDYD